MAPSFKPALLKLARQELRVSWTRWLQLAVCAAIAWAWLRPGAHKAAPAPMHQSQSQGTFGDAAGFQLVSGARESPADEAGASVTQNGSLPHDRANPSLAQSSPAQTPPGRGSTLPQSGSGAQSTTAALGASTIDVIVSRNDTLDHIFRKLNLSLADLATLRSMPGIKAYLDSLRPGESLHVTHRDTELVGLERRLNENETLKVVRENGDLHANVLHDPLEGRIRTIRGVIDHSLFEAVTQAGAHDQTAVNLAEIFGWDIDFVLDIQPGDSFAVTYRELYLNGVYVKDGPVLAAKFVNQGRAYFAVRYVDPDGSGRYFTPDGRSMHKAFLRAPVEFTRISSRFNTRRVHPILNLIRAHKGIDYAAPVGTPVRAAGDGRIGYAGPKGGYGNVVEIEHSRSIMTVYGHLSRFAKGLHVGQHVVQGTVIAYVGMTGLATGPHLHYEYRVNGIFKNPQTVPLPDAAPIEARWRDDFLAKSAPMLSTLEAPLGAALVAR